MRAPATTWASVSLDGASGRDAGRASPWQPGGFIDSGGSLPTEVVKSPNFGGVRWNEGWGWGPPWRTL